MSLIATPSADRGRVERPAHLHCACRSRGHGQVLKVEARAFAAYATMLQQRTCDGLGLSYQFVIANDELRRSKPSNVRSGETTPRSTGPSAVILGICRRAWRIFPMVFTRKEAECLKLLISCAVQRHGLPAGASPARQLSLQPVVIGAVVEVTKRLKPSMQRVA